MKIALIDVNYGIGSTGKIVEALNKGLTQRGHCVRAYFGRSGVSNISGVHKISSVVEVLIHAFLSRVTGIMDHYSPIATLRLIKKLREFDPDVVHLHDLHGYFLNIGMLMAFLKVSNIPVLWTFHCEYMYTGRCGYALECDKWKTCCHNCPSLRSYPRSLFFDFSRAMFNRKKILFSDFKNLHITVPSKWLLNRVKESIVSHIPVSVIHNGVDVSIFRPQSTEALKKKLGITSEFVVLSVGSNIFSEIKGGRWILELAERNSKNGIVFIVIGADSIPPKVPDNVIIIRSISDQGALATYYSLADVLLLPSKKETFSMVCAESLACGTPVIGFDSGAPKEVAPYGFGIFIPYGDINLLDNLLLEVLSKKTVLESKGNCVEFGRSHYSNEIMVDAYEKKYCEVINKK